MSPKPLLALLLGIGIYSAPAQTFSYDLQKDSSGYTVLSGAVVLSTAENFRSKSFTVDIPFAFNFCGSAADSITIEGNGFIVFNKEKATAIVAYTNFGSNKDTTMGYSSSILCKAEGDSGNKIFKIEFKNLSQSSLSANDHLSYQVWLYENGNKIEFHTGTNSYAGTPGIEIPVLLGLINKNMDTENNAFLLYGDPHNPSGQLIAAGIGFVYLDNVPAEGTIIKLTPTF